MKNLLTLHEAVILILLKKPNRTASYDEIAKEIEKRNLFPIRKGNISLSEQIKLRTSIASSKYKHLFQKVSENEIRFT
ncbi:hypothetical protein [Flavobacterium microcysteis]|uniref:HTH HARE-type domain-containing protein n=1 Tax=Flavobacterium microcysteis TaxID=2596891 RepID=A0A501QBJ6_9FLAO|nr:hypothetical protein [Flavobacterium microcysteis]TPD69762.1 hypothetical protein FJA49_07590 [Flavobacterium microcysteis]